METLRPRPPPRAPRDSIPKFGDRDPATPRIDAFGTKNIFGYDILLQLFPARVQDLPVKTMTFLTACHSIIAILFSLL